MKTKKIRKFVWLPNGKKESAQFDRKTDAEAWFNRRKSELQRSKALGLDHIEEITFTEAAQRWFQYSTNNNQQKTNYEYNSIITIHLNPLYGSRHISKLRRNDAEILISKLNAKGLTPKTISKIYGVFKTIIKYSISHGYLARDHFVGLKTPRNKSKRVNYLSMIEAEKLLSTSRDSQFYGIVLITLNTGMRLGEVLGLCWDCIDLPKKRISISRSLDRYGLKEHTKNGKHREVPMTDVVLEFLQKLKIKDPFQRIVFNDSGEFWSPDHFKQRHFDPLVRNAEIKKCRFHDLRHTFATHYMQNKGNLFDLQKLLGHLRIDNTLIYAHHSIDHLQNSAQIIQFGRGEVSKTENSIEIETGT